MDDHHSAERRKYKRIKKHFILTYWDMADPGIKHDASQMKNISFGGMCLITARSFHVGTSLAIEMKTPFISDLTHLEGKVLASDEKIKNVIYETRVQFYPLSPQAEFVLKKMMEYFEKEEEDN